MAYTTINKSSDHFNTKLFTGNGSTNAITGVNFQPGLTWLKSRSGANDNQLYDSVRTATKYLRSESTDAEGTASDGLTSFDSDGFTLGSGGTTNASSASMVSWNWKANGAGSSNSDGSVSSTVSANTTAGFSIVKYTNPSSGSPFTVGHGLGAAPKMIIIKNLSASQTWGVYHASLGFGKYLRLDSNAAEASANLVTATSSTTFSTYQDHHSTGNELIAYCFAEKTGYSRFGSYIGNGNADGPMSFLGFKPAFVMIKRSIGGTDSWFINDAARSTFNPSTKYMRPNESSAEGTSTAHKIDLLSNGFKVRSTDTAYNTSGHTYTYYAFAKAPLVGSNNIVATAR
tara:strand:+ start:1920 stop:2948 length:1029 start_codon:yes stop_codon:yes gene_type:complete